MNTAAPTELLAIQRTIKRTAGEIVPMHELQRLRDGGDARLSTPALAIELIANLPPTAMKRRRVTLAPQIYGASDRELGS